MDLPLVNSKEQRRPSLKAGAVNHLVKESQGDEQALYVLLGATGLRVSEALALESKHFVNDGRTIEIQQQVDRETPRIVSYLKTDAGFRQVDLSRSVAEYLQAFINGRNGLLFKTRNSTHTCTTILNNAGLHLSSKRCDSTKKVWASMLSVGSAKHGSGASAAKRTSTIFGWGTSRKQCPNSIRAWTKSLN